MTFAVLLGIYTKQYIEANAPFYDHLYYLINHLKSATCSGTHHAKLSRTWRERRNTTPESHTEQTARVLPVVTENLVCMLTLSAGETDQGTGVAAMQGVLDLKAGSAEKNPAWLATKLLWFIRRTEAIVSEDRLILSGVALVSVMKSSDLRNHYDAPAFWLLHGPRFRSIFGQRQMSSGVVVVGKITSQSPAQRSFIPHDDVV
jgi:hypothetical protein